MEKRRSSGELTPILHKPPDELLEPFKYLEQTQSKGIRPKLIDAFNVWFKIDEEQLNRIKTIVTMLHNASLLIDDIEDGSNLRRGNPVAHKIFGVPNVLNCSNYVYFLAFEEVNNLGSPEAISSFIEEMLNLHRGQGYDIYWRDSNECPDENRYKQMVIDKTGGLFRLATRLMQAFSENKSDFIPLVNNLGLYYQIRDDYMNLKAEKYMENKSFCEDLTEGKFSFPIIHSIKANPKDRRLLNILRRKTDDVEIKKHAVEYMESTGSFDYTLKVLKEIKEELIKQVEDLGGNEQLIKIVEYLEKSEI